MTIREAVEMMYNQSEVINITIHLIGGMKGKTRTMNKTEVFNFIEGYEEEKVVSFGFNSYNPGLYGNYYPKEVPSAWIEYIC